MQDRVPVNAGRVRMTPVAGQTNVFDMQMADGASIIGTPLNKATFLKDATAALYGLPNTAVPDDVFSFLGKFNEYNWKRRTKNMSIDKSDITNLITVTTSSIGLYYSNELNDDGTLKNPQDVAIYASSSGATTLASKAPCYIRGLPGSSSNVIFYLPAGTTGGSSRSNSIYYDYNSGTPYLYLSNDALVKPQKVNSVVVSYGEWEDVYSPNRNAYPDSGIVDGYEYQFIGKPFDVLLNPVHIATGSYIGTGTYGSNNPNSLTFDFEPKLVMIYGIKQGTELTNLLHVTGTIYAIPTETLTTTYTRYFGFGTKNYTYGKKSDDGKMIYWYSTNSSSDQRNESNQNAQYYYLAIG